jgi:ParB family chromosome partitioning protein
MAAKKKRGLGRGLDALLGSASAMEASVKEETASGGSGMNALPVDLIQRGRFQPRRDFNPERLQELADSIAAQGVVQPIVVRPVGGDRYEIIAGERRWRAAQQAGLDEIPAVVRDVDDQAAMAMALIENIQRDDLNPLEEADALHRLLNEFELTHQEIAKAVGKSRTTVTNLLRLLELNGDVKEMIEGRRLEMGHARALLGLKGEEQSHAARQVSTLGLSVRETEKLVRRMQGAEGQAQDKKSPPKEDPNVRRLQDDLGRKLGARVNIQQGRP